jgi:hypothetical protein
MLLGMCAGLIAGAISVSAINTEPEEKQAAFSIQNGANIFIHLGRLIFNFVCKPASVY